MSNENWTKGEWNVDEFTVYALNKQDVNQFSALIQGNGRKGGATKELLANARLISAAPDLYEALKAIMEQHRKHYGLDGAWDKVLTDAEKTLVKARKEI